MYDGGFTLICRNAGGAQCKQPKWKFDLNFDIKKVRGKCGAAVRHWRQFHQSKKEILLAPLLRANVDTAPPRRIAIAGIRVDELTRILQVFNDSNEHLADSTVKWRVDILKSFKCLQRMKKTDDWIGSKSGLAKAFMAGLEASLKAGADIIINTDADNQYCADDIPYLIQPIILRQAEIVVGQRPIWETKHFSYTKKLLQQLGSWVVRIASNTNIPDAPSGFRAFSREAAMQLNVFNSYTYTLETIIQAGQKGITITSIPIRTTKQFGITEVGPDPRSNTTRSCATRTK